MLKRIIWMVAITSTCLLNAASANPIIFAPSGTTLTTGQVRAEAAASSDNANGQYYWLSTGLMQYEVDLLKFHADNGRDETQMGAQWSFLPETLFTPAVGFGVRDLTSQSKEGIGFYTAITRHLPLSIFSPILKDFALTAGFGVAGVHGPFCGFEAKLPWNIFAQGEYDSRDINAALGWQPNKYFRLKTYSIRSEFYFGAEIPPIQF